MANRIKGITVEIGGDTTKLDKALKGVNSTIRNTQMGLRDVKRLLKLDPKNTELLAQKQKLLSSAITSTKEKLEALKDADIKAKAQLNSGNLSQDKYDALQREIVETENKLKSLEEESKKASSSISKIADSGEKLKTVGSSIENVGKKMSYVSAGIIASGVASAKLSMDFEDALAKVSTIADTTQVPLKTLEKSIMDLSNQTGISSSEIAENVYNAISSGQKTGDAVNFVANSTKLAKAGFAETGFALDVLTTIMNAYGLKVSEVNKVSDMLIQTQNLGKTTVGQLSSSMGKVIPTANAYGVELNQVCTAYALMTSKGIATAESTTYMNSMLNELGKSGTKSSKILKEKTGMSFSELMSKGYSLSDVLAIVKKSADSQGLSFSDMFTSGEAAKAGLSILGDGAENFNSVLNKMNTSTGATDTAFNKLKTNSYNISLVINQLKNSLITLGAAIIQTLAPIFQSLAEKISSFTAWFNSLSETSKRVIVIVGLIVASIGPLLLIIGKVISMVGTIMTIIPALVSAFFLVKGAMVALNAVMIANPIGLIIAAIGALVAAFIYLWNNCEEFRNFWINLWEVVKNIAITVWQNISVFFTTAWKSLSDTVNKIFNGIKTFLSNIWNGIKIIFETIFNIIKTIVYAYFNAYKTIILTVFNAIKVIVITIWNAIKTIITTVINVIKSVVFSAFNAVKSNITSILNVTKSVILNIWNGIKSNISNVINIIRSVVSSVFNSIRSTISNVFYSIKSVTSSVWNGIKNAIISPIENAKLRIRNIVNSIKGFFANMKLRLPRIKLPHFSISGRLSLAPPSVPHLNIDWYKEGGIMTKPTLFGMNGSSLMAGGEAGKEAILPLSGFYNTLNKMLDEKLNTSIMENYLSIIADNSLRHIVSDSGELVGVITPKIDKNLGDLKRMNERRIR